MRRKLFFLPCVSLKPPQRCVNNASAHVYLNLQIAADDAAAAHVLETEEHDFTLKDNMEYAREDLEAAVARATEAKVAY